MQVSSKGRGDIIALFPDNTENSKAVDLVRLLIGDRILLMGVFRAVGMEDGGCT